jgi:predicted NBD/HSP70 family sugar kinase
MAKGRNLRMNAPVTGKPEIVKELNRRLVYEFLRRKGTTSRIEIARETHLSKATVGAIVMELLQEGYVREVGHHAPGVGRPRVVLEFVPDARFVIGSEITDAEYKVILADLHARPVRSLSYALGSLSPEQVVETLLRAFTEIGAEVPSEHILGAGVSVPATVDSRTGQVLSSVVLGWQDVPLGALLSQRAPWPVAVFSRGNAGAWGEKWRGAGRHVANLLYVRIGTGIGAGLVLNGQPYFGKGFSAGEIGHTTVAPEGPVCLCGNRGCLAAVAAVPVLAVRARHLARAHGDRELLALVNGNLELLELAHIIQAGRAGNPLARQVLAEAGQYVGLAIANALNLLDLEMVIIGGPLAEAGDLLLEPIRAEVARRGLPTVLGGVQVVLSALGPDAAAIGAASLVLRERSAPLQVPQVYTFPSRPFSPLPAGVGQQRPL